MALSTRIIHLDEEGYGVVTVPPCFFAGELEGDGTEVFANDRAVGIGPFAYGDMEPVEGSVAVSGGTPGSDVILAFDFSA